MLAIQRVLDSRLIAILRADDGSLLIDAAEALLAGGIDVLEITFTVPQAHRVLEAAADRLGDRLLLGAGTVLDPETARIAILAGAEFIVAPNTNLDVIAACKRYSKPIMPGALTPTEVVAAWQAGADFVKVFPCDVLGPAHIKALKGPLPQVRMIPTGGVNLETARAFLDAGASALGVGSALVNSKQLAAGNFDQLASLARQYRNLIDAR